jgi:hypothetical protein
VLALAFDLDRPERVDRVLAERWSLDTRAMLLHRRA